MKNKLKTLCVLAIAAIVMVTGCSSDPETTSTEESTERPTSIWSNISGTSYDNLDSYKFTGSVLFLPVSYETVDNGDCNKTVFTEFVYVPDRTLWIESYKTLTGPYKGGIGQSMVQILDFDGKPKLYDGDLDALCEKYGVNRKED